MTTYVIFKPWYSADYSKDAVFVASSLELVRAYFAARPLLPRSQYLVVRYTAGEERGWAVDHKDWWR
jgi:hypothetical protein